MSLMHEPGILIGTSMLVGLLGIVFIVRRFAPQLGQRLQRAGRLQHLGFLSLTPQCSVALVRIEREILVLGVTPQAVTLLTKTHDLDAKEERNGVTVKGQRGGTAELQSHGFGEAETTL